MRFELFATVQKALPHVSCFSARQYEENLYQEQMVCLFFFEKHIIFFLLFALPARRHKAVSVLNYSIAINH